MDHKSDSIAASGAKKKEKKNNIVTQIDVLSRFRALIHCEKNWV